MNRKYICLLDTVPTLAYFWVRSKEKRILMMYRKQCYAC
jgi:hypothetical protein